MHKKDSLIVQKENFHNGKLFGTFFVDGDGTGGPDLTLEISCSFFETGLSLGDQDSLCLNSGEGVVVSEDSS